MSRIYFHTPTQTVEVLGSELHDASALCKQIAAGVFDQLDWDEKLRLFPDDSSVRRAAVRHIRERGQVGIEGVVMEAMRTALAIAGDGNFRDGSSIFELILNTVLVMGSEELRFVALLTGQCAIHGYVEPEDTPWLARVIEQALEVGMLRRTINGWDTGWLTVIQFLRSATTPVVTSYSVAKRFSNLKVARMGGTWSPPRCEANGGTNESADPNHDYCVSCHGEGYLLDGWEAMSNTERWDLAWRGYAPCQCRHGGHRPARQTSDHSAAARPRLTRSTHSDRDGLSALGLAGYPPTRVHCIPNLLGRLALLRNWR